MSVQALMAAVEEFAQEYVGNPRYGPRWPTDPKIIHDPLWGTVRLHPWEVAILDLPLIQRLRQIHQTSLVNYVFPGCNHTRFEHTLGVIHQAQRLAEAVNGQAPPDRPPFDHNTIRDLRLAALFHDCGHGCFSHISEGIYEHCADMEAATLEDGPYRNGHAHEILGALIMQAEPVAQYLSDVADHYKVQFNVPRAAGWIVNHCDDEHFRFHVQVVNGPFDADKLDYIFRDAHYSGLPLSLDLDRLWATCTVQRHSGPKGPQDILTLHRGSTNPLEQILFNKINLYSVVYQHPKVRAVEAMFQGVIEHLRENGLSLAGRNLESATDFLWITDDTFFAAALAATADSLLHQMIHAILYRRHFVRALTISRDTVRIEDDSSQRGYTKLLKHNQRGLVGHTERRRIAKAIWEKAAVPCSHHEVWLDLPPDPPIGEADKIFVRMPAGSLRKMSDFFPLDYWSDLYKNHKWRGHVFCPPQYQRKVHQVARSVIQDEFGFEFNDSARELSHVQPL